MTVKRPNVLVGFPGKPFRLANALRDKFVEKRKKKLVVRFGFAYVSNSGLDTLLQKLESVSSWDIATKEWIVGLHHGITEPAALKRIRALNNSSLRLYLGGKTLSESSIRTGLLFHGKIACITVGAGKGMEPTFLLASSANLTGSALASESRNYEAGITLHDETIHRTEYLIFHEWWTQIWKESVPPTDQLINQ
jgi:HKD family nuclease